jgi:hypothetical protein
MLVAALGFVAIVVVVLRIVLRPEEVDGYEFEATLKMAVLVTLLGAILVTAGGVVGVRRDREAPLPSAGHDPLHAAP